MTKDEKLQLHRIMENLDCDEETAKEIMETDKRIDKGEKLFELTEELEAGARKARSAGNCKGYTKPKERTKAEDTEKRTLINAIFKAIEPLTDENTVYINNAERELEFIRGGKKYKIVLSCPRS